MLIYDVELLDFIVKYRAMNDPEFIAFMTDQNIVKEGGKLIIKHMMIKNVENHYAGPIRQEN